MTSPQLANGDEVANFADALDAGGDLSGRRFGLLGGGLTPELGHPVVDLDVDARHVHGARVLAYAGPYPLPDLFLLLGDPLDATPALFADKRPGGRIGVAALGARAVGVLGTLVGATAPRIGCAPVPAGASDQGPYSEAGQREEPVLHEPHRLRLARAHGPAHELGLTFAELPGGLPRLWSHPGSYLRADP